MQLIKIQEITGHQAGIYSCVSWNKTHLFTSSGDQYVALWNLNEGKQETFSIKCEGSAYHINLINKENILVIGSSKGELYFIDLILKKEVKHYTVHKSSIFFSLENTKTNQFYVSDGDGNLSVWNLSNLKFEMSLPFQCGKIRSMVLSEDSNWLYLACQDGNIRILDTVYFNETSRFFAHKEGCLSIITFDDFVYSSGKDGYIRIWNKTNLSLIKEIPAHNFAIYQLLLLNNKQNLISISRDKSIKLWDINTMTVLQKIERKHGGHSHSVNSCCQPSKNEVITVGDDKRIIHWKLGFKERL
ncbi:MAG: hypothetical protein HYU67_09895 [Flavobacteriia bacterium]|nr:hypothetical protein [Flavobacteriia bacterium]